MQTDDIAAWLTQIWDEEEQSARFAHDLAASIDYGIVDFQWVRFVRDALGGMVRSHSFDAGAPSPASVLARIVADRKILALHVGGSYPDECGLCNESLPCETVRLLAEPYADRPGYNEQWRP